MLLIMGAAGLWLIDLGNLSQILNVSLDNSFFQMSGQRAFHIGMYLSIVSLVGLAFMVIILKRTKE